jgi:hypothetical protein
MEAMPHIQIGLLAFACLFGGAVLGLAVGRIIPKSYTIEDNRNLVEASMKMVSLLSALVLGLLTVTAQSKFDARIKSIEQFAANLSLLNRKIQNFNPEIEGLKDQLRQYTAQKILLIWPQPDAKYRGLNDNSQDLRSLEGIVQKIREFAPPSETQRFVQASALKIAGELTGTRWTLAVQEGSEPPSAFIYVLLFWLTLLFINFGLFAQRNALAIVAVFVCAFSLASAIYIIMDLNEPIGGFISISPKPMQDALAQMAP